MISRWFCRLAACATPSIMSASLMANSMSARWKGPAPSDPSIASPSAEFAPGRARTITLAAPKPHPTSLASSSAGQSARAVRLVPKATPARCSGAGPVARTIRSRGASGPGACRNTTAAARSVRRRPVRTAARAIGSRQPLFGQRALGGVRGQESPVGADLDPRPDHLCRVARDDRPGRHGLRHHRPRAHHAVVDDLYTWKDEAASADEAVGPDSRVKVEPARTVVGQDAGVEGDIAHRSDVDADREGPVEFRRQRELRGRMDVHAPGAAIPEPLRVDDEVAQAGKPVQPAPPRLLHRLSAPRIVHPVILPALLLGASISGPSPLQKRARRSPHA